MIRIAISLLALFDWDEGGILWNLRSNLRVFIRDILNLLSLLRLKRLESLDSLRLRRLREGLKLRLRLILKLILSLWLIYWLNLWLELTLIFDLPWNLGLNRWPLNLLDITVRILKKLLIFAQLAVLIFLSFYFSLFWPAFFNYSLMIAIPYWGLLKFWLELALILFKFDWIFKFCWFAVSWLLAVIKLVLISDLLLILLERLELPASMLLWYFLSYSISFLKTFNSLYNS